MADTNSQRGKVYLIGAGPGDAGLLTLRGAEVLSRADVVLYDYLANEDLLCHAAPQASLICLGKHGRTKIWSQDEICQRIVADAQSGKIVARLKGGDAMIFGRAAEELNALTTHGIPFEIVPGVTTALAAGSHAGIPVTHRDHASAVAFVTGHAAENKQGDGVDFSLLATFPGTLVIYMGVTTAPEWTAALLKGGKPASTPVAIVRHCSRPDQQVIRCRLDELTTTLSPPSGEKIRPPAIVIVGDVAKLAGQYDWFSARPLFGQTVLVTRPEHQAPVLAQQLGELGANVITHPAIEIRPPNDLSAVDEMIARIDDFDWLVFSSSNGVAYFLDRLLQGNQSNGRDLRMLGHLKLATVGSKTAEHLAEYHLRADVIPGEFRAEALADSLASYAKQGERFLLLRASRGREVLAEQLTAFGGHVEQVVVYESCDAQQAMPHVAAQLAEGKIDWVTVTSSAIAKSLVALFGEDLRQTRLASISPLTTQTLSELGFSVAAEAKVYTTEGVVAAIADCQNSL